MERGTVVLAVLPFTDLSSKKRRPAIIISPENPARQDVVVAFVTSYKGEPLLATDLMIAEGNPDFREAGLKVTSVIKLDKLFTLQKGLVIGKLGTLSSELMGHLESRLRVALGLK